MYGLSLQKFGLTEGLELEWGGGVAIQWVHYSKLFNLDYHSLIVTKYSGTVPGQGFHSGLPTKTYLRSQSTIGFGCLPWFHC